MPLPKQEGLNNGQHFLNREHKHNFLTKCGVQNFLPLLMKATLHMSLSYLSNQTATLVNLKTKCLKSIPSGAQNKDTNSDD